MKKTNLLMMLMTSSFLIQDAYAMEEDEKIIVSGESSKAKIRVKAPVHKSANCDDERLEESGEKEVSQKPVRNTFFTIMSEEERNGTRQPERRSDTSDDDEDEYEFITQDQVNASSGRLHSNKGIKAHGIVFRGITIIEADGEIDISSQVYVNSHQDTNFNANNLTIDPAQVDFEPALHIQTRGTQQVAGVLQTDRLSIKRGYGARVSITSNINNPVYVDVNREYEGSETEPVVDLNAQNSRVQDGYSFGVGVSSIGGEVLLDEDGLKKKFDPGEDLNSLSEGNALEKAQKITNDLASANNALNDFGVDTGEVGKGIKAAQQALQVASQAYQSNGHVQSISNLSPKSI